MRLTGLETPAKRACVAIAFLFLLVAIYAFIANAGALKVAAIVCCIVANLIGIALPPRGWPFDK
jgi:hypothetical protein